MGNGALPNGPSYRAHPRLCLNGHAGSHQKCPLLKVHRPCHRPAVTSQVDPNRSSHQQLIGCKNHSGTPD
jgi:hypothetical protein